MIQQSSGITRADLPESGTRTWWIVPPTAVEMPGLIVGHILDRPAPWETVQWHDVIRDGRYLQRRADEHLHVQPADRRHFATLFSAWIERTCLRLTEFEQEESADR